MRVLVLVMLGFSICLWYDMKDFRNLSTAEAMDSAQVARNLADGKGFTTEVVRPLSIYLVSKWNLARGVTADPARLKTAHPDLANPPLYPVFLAGLMKILPFEYAVKVSGGFWSADGSFARYEPDFMITLVNQLLLLVIVWQTYLIARKLFDLEVAAVSAILVFFCEQLWEFSVSGLSTILILVIFLGLVQLLVDYEMAVRDATPEKPVSDRRLLGLAIAAGALVGLGVLTRYAFGWLILPVVGFLVAFGGKERWRHGLSAGGVFLVLLAPWVARNYLVSGTPFGTASFTIAETSYYYPAFKLERSLHPDLTPAKLIMPYVHKLCLNAGDILANEWPRLGGSWAAMLFFAGLLMTFRRAPIRRLRYFMVAGLLVLTVVEALGRTELTVKSPVVNSENLLVLLVPLVIIYGTGFFFTFLDQYEFPLQLPLPPLRYAAITIFSLIICLPMLGTLFSAGQNPVVFPPYFPPDLQKSAAWMKSDELMMSDIPWAVAWYGDRQCLWQTLNTQDDFYAINDYLKPVKALYLSQSELDRKILTECLTTPANSWGNFYLKRAAGAETDFPLHEMPTAGLINSGMLLTDRPRWLETVK